jgi:hypothetical protein
MIIVGFALFVTFALIGLLHAYWLTGGLWPGEDLPTFNAHVVGTTVNRAPDQRLTFVVVSLFFSACGLVLSRHGVIVADRPQMFIMMGYGVMAFVFAARGVATYTPAFNYAKGTPFYRLNRRYFGPLCLAIAAALLVDFPYPAG